MVRRLLFPGLLLGALLIAVSAFDLGGVGSGLVESARAQVVPTDTTPNPTAVLSPTPVTPTLVPSPTTVPSPTMTMTPTATAIVSPSPTMTGTATVVGQTPADLVVTALANPNPVLSGQLLSLFVTVSNQGGTASVATHLRVPIPAGASYSPTGANCYTDPYTGQSNCSGTTTGNCVLNGSVGQYYNTVTGQYYPTYTQCISASGGGAGNCVLNAANGQYYNSATGQYYGSYDLCVNSGTVGTGNCVLNSSIGQYYSSVTGQYYPTYNQCISATGGGTGNCVLNASIGQYYNSSTGQYYPTYNDCVNGSSNVAGNCVLNSANGLYYNTSTGQYYQTYSQCVSTSTNPSGCSQTSFVGYVDCPIAALQPGASASITVSFVVTAPGGSIFDTVQVDPENAVTESNKNNNSSGIVVSVAPGSPPIGPQFPPPPYEQPPLPTDVPVAPIVATPVIPPVQPAPPPPPPVVAVPAAPAADANWLHVLNATEAYSVTMDPLWMTQPGDWYFVVKQQDGWALAVWEGDTSDWTEWIQIDPRVEIVASNRAIPQLPLWMDITSPTPAYSVTMDLLWIAQPGERYKVRQEEDGWALVIWEHDSPDMQEWIQEDERVAYSRQ